VKRARGVAGTLRCGPLLARAGSRILNIVYTERQRFARPGDPDPNAALLEALQQRKVCPDCALCEHRHCMLLLTSTHC